jgi:hypothetical protein
MEYFTTSSLVYAAAAIEQGFEGCETNIIGYSEWTKQFIPSVLGTLQHRFPKTPHNVALMEAREGDMIMFRGKFGAYVISSDSYTIPAQKESNCDHCFSVLDGGTLKGKTIIRRNNKPFPVWDKE